MPQTSPGEAVPSNSRSAWYAWRTAMAKRGDPRSDDPLANYEFGVRIGQRMAIDRTAQWAGLVPVLQDVLDYLLELAIERDMDAGVDLTGTDGSSESVVPVTGGAVPDLTVEDTSVQQGAA